MTDRAPRTALRTGAIVAAPPAAVALAVFGDGGNTSGFRLAYGAAAVAALAVVVAAGGRPVLRQPPVLALLGLAALGALSALWTVGPTDRTLSVAELRPRRPGLPARRGLRARRRLIPPASGGG